jgi:SPP1 family predicted phage head-tail adaptor
VNAGTYDRICEVLIPDNTRGSAGGVKRRWTGLFKFYAAKAEAGSRAFRAAGVTNVEVTAVFTTHYNTALKARQRFDCEGQIWEIVGPPRELGRREETLIEARTIEP